MNVLIIKLSPVETITSSMFRTLAIARGIKEFGNNVDVLVAPYNGINAVGGGKGFVNQLNIIRTDKNEVYAKGASTNGSGGRKRILVSLVRSIWHKLSVYDYTYSIAKKIDLSILPQKKYDIVISSSDPKSSHIAVKRLIKQGLQYDRWIEYWGDPLTIDITRLDIWPAFVLKRIEKKLLTGADKIVYVSPFTLKEQQKLFPQFSQKMMFLPVAYMDEEIYEKAENKRFVIGYYGNYENRVRNIIPFYDACVELGNLIDVSIYGDTNIKLKSTDYIKIYPRGVVDEHKAKADLLICLLNSTGTQIPGKLYHLAGTNKKVLVIVDGEYSSEMEEYLDGFNRFYICENNKGKIISMIKKILKDDKEFLPVDRLRYDYIAGELIK